MQIFKYCHCLLFVNEEGLPITEYLPEDHEGRDIYGLVPDPTEGDPDESPSLAHSEGSVRRQSVNTRRPPSTPSPAPRNAVRRLTWRLVQ